MGILSLLLWTPLVGGVVLALLPVQTPWKIRLLSNSFAIITLVWALISLAYFETQNPLMQLTEHWVINAELGNTYALGVDGFSLPMVLLGSLLMCIAMQASAYISHGLKTYFASMLFLEFGMLGVFLTQDWIMFYIFWELTLIPLFFLIDRWGGARRHAASLNFVLYTIGGSLFMMASLFALGEFVPHMGGSLMTTFAEAAKMMPPEEQLLVLIGFLIGFGVKLPIFPIHGWLPLVHVEAPFPVSVLLSGILLKMGAYGLLRVVSMLPQAVLSVQAVLVGLALFSMLYGGLLAWRQSDLKAMVAYSSISHMGVVLLGILTFNVTGMMGAILQMTAHGLTAGALFLLLGWLYKRTGTLNIQDYSSLAPVIPRFAALMTIALLAAMGLPGTLNFVAELHAIIGGFERWGAWMVFFSFSILVSAAYAIRTLGLLFTGPVKPRMQGLKDLSRSEFLMGSVLMLLIVVLGFMPSKLMDLSEVTIKHSVAALATATAASAQGE